MKKFVGNTPLKILAVVLSFVVFFTMIISVASSAFMFLSDFYTRDFETLEKSIMKELAQQEMTKMVSLYDSSDKIIEKYYEDKNVLYYIKNSYSGEVTSNFKDQDYIVSYSTNEFVTRFVSGELGDEYYDEDDVRYNSDTQQYYFYAENNIVYKTTQKAEFTIYIPSLCASINNAIHTSFKW